MKKLLIILSVVFLTACNEQDIARHFPNVPDDLKVSCPDLATIDESTTKLSDVVGVVAKNYGQYNDCRDKVNAWIDWYNTQKAIFDSVK